VHSLYGELHRRARFYELAYSAFRSLRELEAYATCAASLAEWTAAHHAGRFADSELENRLLELSQSSTDLDADLRPSWNTLPPFRESLDRHIHVLHVATKVLDVGGHTRTIQNWAAIDSENQHSLFVTQQCSLEIPGSLFSAIRATGGGVNVALSASSAVETAAELRALARESDLVVLHHHSEDVVPIIAFARQGGPPVLILNHADHMFWLGSSISDGVINLRGDADALCMTRRATRCVLGLPIPLAPIDDLPSKNSARAAIGVPLEAVAYLTVARACKFGAVNGRGFFEAAERILCSVDDSVVIAVGVGQEVVPTRFLERFPGRVFCLGVQSDTRTARAAADVYLETFPFGSHTSVLEAARAGLPVVLSHASPTKLLRAYSNWFESEISENRSEDEYVSTAVSLGMDAAMRIQNGQRLRSVVARVHCNEGWRGEVHRVYEAARAMQHRASMLPPVNIAAETVDIALVEWQVADGRTVGEPHQLAEEWILGVAYRLRNRGLHRSAARLLICAYMSLGRSRRIALELAKVWPHWALLYAKTWILERSHRAEARRSDHASGCCIESIEVAKHHVAGEVPACRQSPQPRHPSI